MSIYIRKETRSVCVRVSMCASVSIKLQTCVYVKEIRLYLYLSNEK